ncbi:nucleotidyltransferase domain-containing protein [bacterium AH-315-C20]|nr:nucleotidyltransferase domain-containing protein [bacterium AH-315-C20]
MIEIIKERLDEVKSLCAEHHVKELYLFGSSANGNFDQKTSDLDLVVNFTEEVSPEDFAENYFSLLEGLERLFERKVDLLSYRALKNEVIIQQIEQTKIPLYAA